VLTELIVAGSLLWFLRERSVLGPAAGAGLVAAGAALTLAVTGQRWGVTAAAVVTGLALLAVAGGRLLAHRRAGEPA
jgi:uncharacterized membrane protein (UPF0136 family)